MNKLDNIDKIVSASKMGYSAVLQTKHGKLKTIRLAENHIVFKGLNESGWTILKRFLHHYKITSYIHVGHLFGEPVIEEGQKFRVKENGKIITFFHQMTFLSPNNKILKILFDQIT